MTNDPAIFACREVEWELCIEPAVLQRFAEHRQLASRAPEVGGQLFAAFEKYRVRITQVTGPREADRRSRFSFFPDRRMENREIKQRFGTGLHFVGDWHTHPEPRPTPSRVDLASMADCFRRSQHTLSYFIMIIVGQQDGPAGLWVSLHDANRSIRMKARSPLQSEATETPDEDSLHPSQSHQRQSPFSALKKALGIRRPEQGSPRKRK